MPVSIPSPVVAAEVEPLFRPFRLGPLDLPHRVVMAPMTRNRANERGVPSSLAIDYYRQRASAALIVTEATQVSREGAGNPYSPGIHSAEQLSAWQRVTDAVHEEGGHIFLQLWHAGRISHSSFHWGDAPVAPSAVTPRGRILIGEGVEPYEQPRALGTEEVSRVVEDFWLGAGKALDAGFDGVEVHCANGYLIDQFLRDGTNRRADRYGGAIENRLRFPLEVIDAVSAVWGSDRVGVRVSPLGGFNDMRDSRPQALFASFAWALGARKLAYLHVVTENSFVGQPMSFDPLSLRNFFGGPIIAAGGYDATSGAQEIESGRTDLVAYARLFLANPDLPRRFAKAAELNDPDPATYYGGGPKGYVDYPFLTVE